MKKDELLKKAIEAIKSGGNPLPFMGQAEAISGKSYAFTEDYHVVEFDFFFSHEELKRCRELRKMGKLNEVENLLLRANPSPAVLDELRKTQSEKAKIAGREGDWAKVVEYLEMYNGYAEKWKWHCVSTVNQEPPPHTDKDCQLLELARAKLKV